MTPLQFASQQFQYDLFKSLRSPDFNSILLVMNLGLKRHASEKKKQLNWEESNNVYFLKSK